MPSNLKHVRLAGFSGRLSSNSALQCGLDWCCRLPEALQGKRRRGGSYCLAGQQLHYGPVSRRGVRRKADPRPSGVWLECRRDSAGSRRARCSRIGERRRDMLN